MNKKIISSLILIIVIIISSFGGYLIGTSSTQSDYDISYKNLEKKTIDEQVSLYQGKLKADTSPSELKYILAKVLPRVTINQADVMVSQYLNHVQYFASTYTDFLSVYQSIIAENSDKINYESKEAVAQISDKVLKSIVSEIYDGDMTIIMPANGTAGMPYATTNYESINETYGKYMADVTKEYIKFKTEDLAKLSTVDGSIDFFEIEGFIEKANNFIIKYPQFVLIDDVKYSYVVAAQMYMGIYNVAEEFEPDSKMVESYKGFIEKNPSTPIAAALKEIIEISEKGEKVTYDKITEYQIGLMSLINNEGSSNLQSAIDGVSDEELADYLESNPGETISSEAPTSSSTAS